MSKARTQGALKAVLLHGSATSSRKKLIDLKQPFALENVITFEEGSSTADILAALQTMSMFGEDRLIIAENPSEDLLTYHLSLITYHLILWFDHELAVKNIPPGIEVFYFPEVPEASMFPFLDSLGDRSKRAFLELEKRNRTSPNDTQYIFTMVFYLLRSLIYLPAKSPEFVKKKMARQRMNFTREKITSLYRLILETDFKIKRGLMEPNQAEFLLVSGFLNPV